MDRRGPLAGSHAGAAALVVRALVPFLALAAAIPSLTKLIGSALHLSERALELTTAMSYAGYAVGTVVSVPPLVIGFGAEAGRNDWRTLFWVVAGIGVGAWILSLLTFEDAEPQDPEAPWDWTAIALSVVGCVAAFFGAAQLEIQCGKLP